MTNDIAPSGVVETPGEDRLVQERQPTVEETLRGLVGRSNFYPVTVPGMMEIPGRVAASEADSHYNIQGTRDRTVVTMGPQAYCFAARAVGIAKQVTHIGDEPLMKKLGELVGFRVVEAAAGKAEIVFYGGPPPTKEVMARIRAHATGPIFIETLPEVDPSDHMTYELAIQQADLVSGFLGYPGMGFDTSAIGRPALFVARRK